MKRMQQSKALRLHRCGAEYQALQQQLGIAKSTLWRWLKADGLVASQPQRLTELKRMAQRTDAAAVQAKYLASSHAITETARKEIGRLSRRELWLIGIALYWAEGTKQKSHNIAQRVAFSNSDPAMAHLMVRWLTTCCAIPAHQFVYELYIHESASHLDITKQCWALTLHIPAEQLRVRFKRHQRATRRRNTGAAYMGLIRIVVRQSAALNRRIAGWTKGIGESANGKPSDFGSEYPGSIPGSPVFEPGILGHVNAVESIGVSSS